MTNPSVIVIAALLGLLALTAVSWKWTLPANRVSWIVSGATLLAVCVGWIVHREGSPIWVVSAAIWTVQAATFLGVISWLFFRDPERVNPQGTDLIVSPADGTVIYVRQLEAGEPLRCEKNGAAMALDELNGTGLEREALWQVGISMVFTDVHVNRAPIAGKVSHVVHRPGKFLSLRRKEALNVNERQTMVIANETFQVCLVQIASRLVRRIVSYVVADDLVHRGQRIGMIKFGSQVDLFVPVRATSSQLDVREGDRLIAGETVVCRIRCADGLNVAASGANGLSPVRA